MITTAQAAQALGISARGVRYLIANGTLPATKPGRDWAIESAAVDQLLATGCRGVGKPSRFAQYVHAYTTDNGDTRHAVGRWDQDRGQYSAPLDVTTAKLTGCSGRLARRPEGMENYASRRKAFRRARYLFGD